MPDPTLAAVTDPPEDVALDGLLLTLRDDTAMVAAGVTVWDDDGDRTKTPEVTDTPDLVQMPLCRVIAGVGKAKWEAEGVHRVTLPIEIKLYCSPGRKPGRKFISLIYGALFPQDLTRKALVRTRMFGVTTNLVNDRMDVAGSRRLMKGSDQYAQEITVVYTVIQFVNT